MVADDNSRTVDVNSARPPAFRANVLTAEVTRDGGLYLNREATLSSDEALALGQWITQTFG
jgi:hypothetical protein